METILTLPKDKEQWAQQEAQRQGGRLLWDPIANGWLYLGKLPVCLEPFAPQAPAKGRKAEAPWVLDVPFEFRQVASKAGARWNDEHQVTTYTGPLPEILRACLPERFTWEEHVARKLGRRPEPFTPRGGVTLHPHQQIAVSLIQTAVSEDMPGFLLADEVGLGKTYVAWAGILKSFKPTRILIVSPVAVLPVWRDIILTMGDGGHDIILINYDRLKKLFLIDEKDRKKVRSLKGLARAAVASEFPVIIWDESHYLKSMYGPEPSARAKLASKLYEGSEFLLWLSATAGQTPLELGYLGPLMGKLTHSKINSSASYEAWCTSQGYSARHGLYGKWEWKPETPEDEEREAKQLNSLLFDGKPKVGIRRRPQDVAGWPEMQRIFYPVALTPGQRALYNEEWKEFCRVMALEGKAKKKESTSGFTALLRLRQKASMLKVDQTTELVLELLENRRAVAVSVEFRDSMAAIEKKLKAKRVECAVIHGSTYDVEEQRLLFQRGIRPVVLFSVREGVSFHQGQVLGAKDLPRAQVVHDLRWSGIAQSQVDGRCHRNGMFCPIYWMLAEHTVEYRVAERLLKRLTTMASTLGDEGTMLREIQWAIESNELSKFAPKA